MRAQRLGTVYLLPTKPLLAGRTSSKLIAAASVSLAICSQGFTTSFRVGISGGPVIPQAFHDFGGPLSLAGNER